MTNFQWLKAFGIFFILWVTVISFLLLKTTAIFILLMALIFVLSFAFWTWIRRN